MPNRRAMKTGRWARSVGPAALAARAGTRWAGTYLAWGDRRRRKREQFVMRTAEDVTKTLGEMKGAVMKVGQVLSLMSGVVPDAMAGELASLQSGAPPMSFQLVEQVFREEHQTQPQKLFRRFEREPFAAASIGQVHGAQLHDGREVAVKVQYPGVREAIDHDLANVGIMISMMGRGSQGLDAGPIVRDLNEGIRGELDYLREARWQQTFADRFRGHPFIRVPEVHHELTTSRILVQEYLNGRPFREALKWGAAERYRLAETVFRFAFGSFYRFGLFNGDPHPGNYLLLDDGRVGFLDYGCVTSFSPEVIDKFKAVLGALYAEDFEGWRAATEEVGILTRKAPFTTQELYDHMHWFWKPVLSETFHFTPEAAAEMVRRNTMGTGQGGAINRRLNIPAGQFFLTRINFGLAGLLASLDVTGPWRGIIAEYAFGAAPSTELGRASAAANRSGPGV
ncbi:MAG: ABC1 kinase family protein [Dehalococcoidia bacterium]